MALKFTVHRPTWLRGTDRGWLLKRKTQQRCCLGFLGKALGAPDEHLIGKGLLSSVWGEQGKIIPVELLECGGPDGVPLERTITYINDDSDTTDELREAQLTALFASAGITVVFTDEEEPCTSS